MLNWLEQLHIHNGVKVHTAAEDFCLRSDGVLIYFIWFVAALGAVAMVTFQKMAKPGHDKISYSVPAASVWLMPTSSSAEFTVCLLTADSV